MTKRLDLKVLDWAGNEVGSPYFEHFDDALDWLSSHIERVYPQMSEQEQYDQAEEYQIINLGDLT